MRFGVGSAAWLRWIDRYSYCLLCMPDSFLVDCDDSIRASVQSLIAAFALLVGVFAYTGYVSCGAPDLQCLAFSVTSPLSMIAGLFVTLFASTGVLMPKPLQGTARFPIRVSFSFFFNINGYMYEKARNALVECTLAEIVKHRTTDIQ